MKMVSIFDFSNYREYLTAWIADKPQAGRGVKGQFAKALNSSSTLISLILNGTKAMNLEQASDLADFMGLNELETDFLFLLVERERAGHHRLEAKLDKKIQLAQQQARKISARVKKDATLTDEQTAIYYSSWVYTGIRNLVATGDYKDAAQIAQRLHLPVSTVMRTLHFLLEHSLIIQKDGKLVAGPTYTHVDAESPFVNKHRQNWRYRGFTMMEQKNENDVFYSCPMSISAKDAEQIRKKILGYIQEVLEVMRPSPSEKVYCLNIDWFEY